MTIRFSPNDNTPTFQSLNAGDCYLQRPGGSLWMRATDQVNETKAVRFHDGHVVDQPLDDRGIIPVGRLRVLDQLQSGGQSCRVFDLSLGQAYAPEAGGTTQLVVDGRRSLELDTGILGPHEHSTDVRAVEALVDFGDSDD